MTTKLNPNPLGEILDDLSRPMIERMFESMDKTFGHVAVEFDGFTRFAKPTGPELKYDPATNEECAMAKFDIFQVEGEIDLRKPINIQVAAWLKETAKCLQRLAKAAERVEDDRDLRHIRKLIAGKIPAVKTDAV